MRILGIETSCDETSAALVEDGVQVLCNVIASSKDTFKSLAGVIPEEAARRQIECMIPVLERALGQTFGNWQLAVCSIDAIAVTRGPGLLGSLLVGTTTARILSRVWKKPLIGVHHTMGHLNSTLLQETRNEKRKTKNDPSFPILTLSVSGGHSDLWLRESHTRGRLLGRTRDDAAGEAFDKGASLLGLPYPGGPALAALAEGGDPSAFAFPLPLHDDPSLDFSFSGLKTALKYLLRNLEETKNKKSKIKNAIAASYQHALCAHLIDRIERALKLHPDIREVHLVGGVSANLYLRNMLEETLNQESRIKNQKSIIRWPSAIAYCTDNAAMIAAAGFFMVQEHGKDAYEPFETNATLSLKETTLAGSANERQHRPEHQPGDADDGQDADERASLHIMG